MVHSQKYFSECIAQACAAASVATAMLSKSTLEIEETIANVTEDLCSGCRLFEHLCTCSVIELLPKGDA
jgi:heterodisulfide reductase subunit A-like polyferredoxin